MTQSATSSVERGYICYHAQDKTHLGVCFGVEYPPTYRGGGTYMMMVAVLEVHQLFSETLHARKALIHHPPKKTDYESKKTDYESHVRGATSTSVPEVLTRGTHYISPEK